MSHKERRIREKEAMKRLIIDSAMDIVAKKGLPALTTRSLAEHIEYSTAVIYEYFETKEDIYQELNELLCSQLLVALKKVQHPPNPDDYFMQLYHATIVFLDKRPQLIELITRMCFGPNPASVPKEFKEIAQLYMDALKACDCKRLKDPKELEAALDIIHSLHVGMLVLSQYERSVEGLKRIGDSLENGIKDLLKAWKS